MAAFLESLGAFFERVWAIIVGTKEFFLDSKVGVLLLLLGIVGV